MSDFASIITKYTDKISTNMDQITDGDILILLMELKIPTGVYDYTWKIRKGICRIDIKYPDYNVHIEFYKGSFRLFNDLAIDENKAIFEE